MCRCFISPSPCSIVLADSLSRFKPISIKCRLDPTLFRHLRQLLTMLFIDLFMTCCNILLLHFLSSFPDENAVGVEALCHPWEFPGVMYAFPSTPPLTAVLGRTPPCHGRSFC